MSTLKTLAAWTEASGKSYPEYINFSRDGDDAIVTVRGAPADGQVGATVSVRIPLGDLRDMCLVALTAEVE